MGGPAGATPRRRGWEPVALPTVYETVMAVHDGRVDRALVPFENSLEGSVNATLDALAFETDDVVIVGERVHPIRHCLVAREPVELDALRVVVSHPQASGQCARFIRTRLPGAVVVPGHLDGGGGAGRRRGPFAAERLLAGGGGPARRPRSATGWPPSATAARSCARASRTSPTTRPASSGSPARAPTRPGRPGRERRSLEDLAGVLGRRRRSARLARALPVGVRLPRGEPHPHRVAPAQAGARPLHVLRRSRGARRADEPVVEAIAGLRAQAEVVRVLGSYPAAA